MKTKVLAGLLLVGACADDGTAASAGETETGTSTGATSMSPTGGGSNPTSTSMSSDTLATGGQTTGGGTDSSGGSDSTGAACPDDDADGFGTCEGDCDDTNPNINPDATEICGDGIDNDCDDDPDPMGVCMGLGTWVSVYGDDMNPGTQQMPVATIGAGIANAITIGNGVGVYVGEGVYSEKVTLVEGIDLVGGYQCGAMTCDWDHDPTTYVSTIASVDFEGVLAPDSITRATSIEGFTILGMDGNAGGFPNASAAFTIAGGSPTVQGNVITGGNSTSSRTSSVRILAPTADPSGPLLTGNQINGGNSGSAATNAVIMESLSYPPPGPTYAEIVGNQIQGGNGQRTTGLAMWTSGAGTLVQGNDIDAGDGGNGGGGGAFAIAVGGEATIDGNRINLGAGVGSCTNQGRWCGGIESDSSTTTITNNVIKGMSSSRSAAVYMAEAEQAVGEVVLNANTLDGGGGPAVGGPGISAAIVFRSTYPMSVNAFVGRIRNNVLLGGSSPNRYGVYEDDMPSPKTCKPDVFEYNDIFFPAQGGTTDVAYRDWDGNAGSNNVTVADAESNLPYVTNTLDVDPDLDAGYHLMAGSPMIDAGVATEAPATDIDGDARPNGGGIDIGADEAG